MYISFLTYWLSFKQTFKDQICLILRTKNVNILAILEKYFSYKQQHTI